MKLGDLPHEFVPWSRDLDPFYGRGVAWALWKYSKPLTPFQLVYRGGERK